MVLIKYQKYKEKFDQDGIGSFTATLEADQIEAKHLSIEEKNKISMRKKAFVKFRNYLKK